MTKLIAPEGYKWRDTKTEVQHSEVITDKPKRFELVPDTTEPIVEE